MIAKSERFDFMTYYVLVATGYSGIYFDEENFLKAKSMNTTCNTACFSDINDAENFLRSKVGSIKKFYAIKNGRINGVVINWNDCENLVTGIAGAKYKSFSAFFAAENYFFDREPIQTTLPKYAPAKVKTYPDINSVVSELKENHFAYVDGSFNTQTEVYGYGVVLFSNNEKHSFSGSGNDKDMATMRNVAGEIEGSMRAIQEAINLGVPEITIYYDYQGIEKWATGEWARNKKGTIAYYNFIQNALKQIKINFKKVKAHSGVELNEIVDRLAKEAVGLV